VGRYCADLLAEDAERLARIETQDNGKLIAEMRGQLRYMPQWYHYFAGLADKIEGRVIPIDKLGVFNFTREEPLGVVTAITPWNSPLMLATWKLAPALAAGNTVVWKPSEFSSASALEFGKLFEKAGFPPGVVNIVTGFGNEIGERLVSHPDVAKVAFTGGDRTGQGVYELAARSIKPVTLELGGKSANIVFDDADLDDAVKGVVSGIFAASGQTCIAGSRALVHRDIHDAFVEKLLAFARTARIGDPSQDDTQVGPITTKPQLAKVLDYIEIARAEGAELALGGKRAMAAQRRVVRRTDHFHRRETRNAHRARGGVRPGALDHTLRGRRGGYRRRQRHDLRARGRRLDEEHQSGPDDAPATGGRHGLDQHLSGDELHVAFRRLQALRHRPRERPDRDPRISPGEIGLDRHQRQRAQSLRPALRRP